MLLSFFTCPVPHTGLTCTGLANVFLNVMDTVSLKYIECNAEKQVHGDLSSFGILEDINVNI